MGRAKADLPFGNETLLQRVVRIMAGSVSAIVVVAGKQQRLPEMPPNVIIANDEMEFAGPLAGIGIGLRTLQARVPDAMAAYVTSCDVPWLTNEVIDDLFARLGNHDVVVPRDDRFLHPLAAIYRTNVAARVDELIAKGVRRPRELFDVVGTLRVDTKSLEHVDSGLKFLENLNTPEEYLAALRDAGFPEPDWLHDAPTSQDNTEENT